MDYTDLENKPQINSVTLSGNKSLSDLGVQPAGSYLTSETDPVFSASASANIFVNSDEYKWIIDNGYKYGFIHRYPKSKEELTGITNEAWHFRYVGKKAAKIIYEEGLSFEEYYAKYLDKSE